MAITKKVRLPLDTITTSSTVDAFFPVTDFGGAGGLGGVRSWAEMRGRFGNAVIVPAFQTANDVRNPDAAAAIPMSGGQAGYANADGVFDPDSAVLSVAIAGKKYVRFGWLVRTTGSIGGARVTGEIELYY